MTRILSALLLVLAALLPSSGLDTLRVGGGDGQSADWSQLTERARFVSVTQDSVWTWRADRNSNLVRDIETRGGMIGASIVVPTRTGWEDAIRSREGLSKWVDGDDGTAWGPDVDAEVGRRSEIFIDLGATFRVDRIRFYPRLDSEHRGLILGRFEAGTMAEAPVEGILNARFRPVPGLSFSAFSPNRQPVVEATFERRDVRYIKLQSAESEPWEIAEFQVFAEGSLPPGELVSEPLFIRGGFPVWGQVSYDGGDLSDLPVTLQTRTGPDDAPLHYFLRRGDELEQVSAREYVNFTPLDYAGAAQVELGPTLPNPEWSTWQTVADGQVLSPAPRRFLQFRLLLREPDTRIGSLFFEYVQQPLAGELVAEIDPLRVDVGQETPFVLSMEIQLDSGRGDTGFRYLQVRTAAAIGQVQRVLVDDEEVVFTPTYEADGFNVDIWQRIIQSGSFVQVEFTATILRDGTAFEVRAQDLRPLDGMIESVYQTARPGDVDPLSAGGELVVRLRQSESDLLHAIEAQRAFSPNGDGINDVFEISYNLLKLTRPAPVSFDIYDLAGRRISAGFSEAEHGQFVRIWTGVDSNGHVVAPGLYLYRVRVQADVGVTVAYGIVSVVR